MNNYWNGIKIKDIENVSNSCGGSYGCNENKEVNEYFTIKMKDGSSHTMHYISHEGICEGEKARIEVKKLYNEYNNVSEIYTIENDISILVNGEQRDFGCSVENNLGQHIHLTNKEIIELTKQFKIRDTGSRNLAYIEEFEIVDNKITTQIQLKHLEQLEHMGYDVSKLEYKLIDEIDVAF